MEVIILAKKKRDQDKKERLPYNIEKDSHNLLRVTVDGVSKKYSRIPKQLRSSLVIVIGIFAIVIIAVFANQPETPGVQTELQSTQPLSRLTDIVINEDNQFQAQTPEIPKIQLDGDQVSFISESQELGNDSIQATDMAIEETEEVQNTMSVIGRSELVKTKPSEQDQVDFQMIYPLRRQGVIVTDYGWYHHPLLEVWRYHRGVDIRCKKGDLVMAVASGIVSQVSENDHEAVLITIEHANGWKSIYGQIGEVSVQSGDQVVKGQQIGFTGQSTTAYEPHLHLEIQYQQEAIDPRKFLP